MLSCVCSDTRTILEYFLIHLTLLITVCQKGLAGKYMRNLAQKFFRLSMGNNWQTINRKMKTENPENNNNKIHKYDYNSINLNKF